MILLVDIGNSRIKWAPLLPHGIGEQQAASYAKWGRAELEAHLIATHVKPERILVSNVGGERIAQLLLDSAKSQWSVIPEFIVSSAQAGGVRNAYTTPEQLGVDRWLSMIAAYQSVRASVCVASVGTATTVDGIDKEGRHLGGIIVPGPDLAFDSLLRNTSDLAERSQSGTVRPSLFADNTLGAIQQGIAHMLAAVIDKSVDEMQERTGNATGLVLTGGASERITPCLKSSYQIVPDLVLQGLALVARSS